ncbi:NUDIX domain-containing protein [Streptomyces calidiresistens]|uniref:NUDIX domain-containing protein n=1 Tax=Streptomyces calidiresistens TaxID=1485586 RepID=A0A7W3T3B1_9ACTN|nr:NUDIX domain-containing protein [Streptomyces calidiresistens]
MPEPGAPAIRAAGCVLWRGARPDGPVGVDPDAGPPPVFALVHRPKYDDWSHPKGKLLPGEDARAGAVREVREETGTVCAPGVELSTQYYSAKGRPKEVRYWLAEALGGAFEPNDEIDELLWLEPGAARERLTHPQDRELLDEAVAALRALGRPAA